MKPEHLESVLFQTRTACRESFVRGLRPEPSLTVSEWADQFRVLGKNSPEPGRWRTDRVPYMREIMDSLSPYSGVSMVVLMAAAQGAKTEAGLNFVGSAMARGAGDILVVLPTVTVAKNYSMKRLAPMIQETPQLRGLVAAPKSRDSGNTILLKEYMGGTLRLTGANSGAGLRSDPVPVLDIDEEDAFPFDLDGEGSPVDLAVQRTAAFRDRKIFRKSTPTIADFSSIYAGFLASDQRSYHVPCPLCGAYQRLIWRSKEGAAGGLVWPEGKPHKAVYECAHCAGTFEEWRKTEMLLAGKWIPSAPGNGPAWMRSYQISALYYPYGWPGNDWGNLAAQWMSDHDEPVKLKTFINLKLGEPWIDRSEAKADAASLFARRESYGPRIPPRAALLVAGADVQADRIEAELVAFGAEEESWSIEYRVFPGDTSRLKGRGDAPSPWEMLDEWLSGAWMSEAGVALGVRAACVDSGYNTQAVTQWCGGRAHRRIWAVKGRTGQIPIWPPRVKKQRGKHPPPVIVGVDTAKERIYAHLRVQEQGPGYCHFPVRLEYSREYFEMLTAEVRIPDYSGPAPRFVWKKKKQSQRNEALDARVYAVCAKEGLVQIYGVMANMELMRLQEAMAAPADPREETAGSGGGWLERRRGWLR
jgi:phage terminase large subunit GpA-like protein